MKYDKQMPSTFLHLQRRKFFGIVTQTRTVKISGSYDSNGYLVTEVYEGRRKQLIDRIVHYECRGREPAACQAEAVTNYIAYMHEKGWGLD